MSKELVNSPYTTRIMAARESKLQAHKGKLDNIMRRQSDIAERP